MFLAGRFLVELNKLGQVIAGNDTSDG
jgi:hypothetical protein